MPEIHQSRKHSSLVIIANNAFAKETYPEILQQKQSSTRQAEIIVQEFRRTLRTSNRKKLTILPRNLKCKKGNLTLYCELSSSLSSWISPFLVVVKYLASWPLMVPCCSFPESFTTAIHRQVGTEWVSRWRAWIGAKSASSNNNNTNKGGQQHHSLTALSGFPLVLGPPTPHSSTFISLIHPAPRKTERNWSTQGNHPPHYHPLLHPSRSALTALFCVFFSCFSLRRGCLELATW